MTQGQEPRIKAWLKGDLCDLQRLAVLLAEGDVRVIHDPDRDAYYLTASEIDRPPDGVAYYDVAREHVAYINGIARTTNMGYRPVKLTGGFSEGDSEHQVIFVESVLELRISMGIPAVTVTTQDGTVVPQPPSPVPARLALANSHADVAQVLKIMGSETLDWSKLFKGAMINTCG